MFKKIYFVQYERVSKETEEVASKNFQIFAINFWGSPISKIQQIVKEGGNEVTFITEFRRVE